MEKVGVLVVSYGARETAMIDAFNKSQNYDVELYVVDKQKNPFNAEKAKVHIVSPSLDVIEILKFARKYEEKIDFGIVGPEKPIIEGVRNLFEEETNIPLICPTKEYALEKSKVEQRLLFQKIVPETNPKFKVFYPKDYSAISKLKKEVYAWLEEMDNQVVVKPDAPAAGKGVGVWGDHFSNREQLWEHFLINFQHGPVIIEEKLQGEESSFQAFCDGKHLLPLPETRDYKRAFDNDKGPNTGGMGSYKDKSDILPFMTQKDREKEIEIVNKLFNKLKGENNNPALMGIPFYLAFIHTKDGPKILENNSRPGDPEIINILPLLKDDFVDICFKMLEANLTSINLERKASVVIYKVPPTYGEFAKSFPHLIKKEEINTPVELENAYKLSRDSKGQILVYPASLEQRNGKIYALHSRTVAVVGIGDSLEEAREKALNGIRSIKGGALWHRTDIASQIHIEKSIQHMKQLRNKT